MEAIINLLMGAGALGAGLFCYILSRRLADLNRLDGGMGGAIAVLSTQVDDMNQALRSAQILAGSSGAALTALTERSEQAAKRLELLLATLHDLPAPSDGAPEKGRRPAVVHRTRARRDEAGLPVDGEDALTTRLLGGV